MPNIRRQQQFGATFDEVTKAKAFILNRFGLNDSDELPKVGVVLGSGLGPFAEKAMDDKRARSLPYQDIPHFPSSSVEGHKGQLAYGFIENTPMWILQGRVHKYEGYTASDVAFSVRTLAALQCKAIVLTNAVGAINEHLEVGDLMVITDHINLTGDNPLVGPNDLRFGPRFVDMTDTYTKALRHLAQKVAKQHGIRLKEGVYTGVLGPSYETPAEISMFREAGGDVVGMSTVYEAIAARHLGQDILGISCITNKASGLAGKTLTHEDVNEAAAHAAKTFGVLLSDLLPRLAQSYDK